MKKLITVFVLCLSMVFVVGTVEAQNHHRRGPHYKRPHHRPPHHRQPPHHRPPHHYPIFQCKAHSAYAFGFGTAPYEHMAIRRALNECRVRTPYGHVCVLDWCRRIR